ncbi:MAG: hypothetical protein U9R08_03850 [Nanoarchaeota archaeon]|nr:hypothetical protein [Nanoarchaeota archaeon]
MKKGAIELSMNFLVLLVIALVVFGMSIWFIVNIYQKASDIDAGDIDAQIQQISCGNQKVCLSSSSKTLIAGKWSKENVITLKIVNVLGSDKNFQILVEPVRAIDTNRNIIDDNRVVHISPEEWFLVKNNDDVGKPIAFNIPKDAIKGTYLYTITVQHTEYDSKEYDRRQFTLTVS